MQHLSPNPFKHGQYGFNAILKSDVRRAVRSPAVWRSVPDLSRVDAVTGRDADAMFNIDSEAVSKGL